MSDTQTQIKDTVTGNDVVLFMKGTKMMPQCGFSSRVAGVLNYMAVDFKDVNVLADGFEAWNQFALKAPGTPAADATREDLAAYRFHSAVHSAMTGVKAPPPPKSTTKFKAPPKRKAGGCS